MSLVTIQKGRSSSENHSLVDQAETQIVELLRQQQFKVGDVIPKELELTEMLGVSRTVVREALMRLKVMGLIESKKKKGSVITSPDIFNVLSKSMNPHILDQDTLKDMFELRLALEVGMADFIFQRITPYDIDELKEIVSKEPESSEEDRFFIEHEIAFHSKLYEISNNQSIKNFQKLLLPLFDYVHNSGLLKIQVNSLRYVSHKGLVDVLESGSPELFRNAMRNHLENHFLRLF
ncbi:MAG: FadR/GntR family transcriptional regulator [Bacteroidota bacterium]